MTTLATHSQRQLVFVFFFVTGVTLPWRILETRSLMAAFAGGNDVPTNQWEACQGMVKLADLPGAVVMARLTRCTSLSLMLVIFFMATKTICRCLAVAFQVFVASRALELGLSVSIAQTEFGFIVREVSGGCLPVTLTMAVATFFAQCTAVLVIFFMATETVFRRVFEQGALVTVFAFHINMLAQQGKAAFVVIKPCRLFPASFAVTADTVPTQGVFVFVILGMAGITILTHLGFVEWLLVTCRTRYRMVLATQHVFGVCVVVEVGGLPSLYPMTGVTFFTKLAFVPLAAIVLFFVAAHAGFWGVFVFIALMTINTLGVNVFAF